MKLKDLPVGVWFNYQPKRKIYFVQKSCDYKVGDTEFFKNKTMCFAEQCLQLVIDWNFEVSAFVKIDPDESKVELYDAEGVFVGLFHNTKIKDIL